jgi:hypothetical protein
LDDVSVDLATRIARKYDALIVGTSPAGGCHVWLWCSRLLDEQARRQAQRWLAPLVEADPGSTSGEHLGRLAGFRNWKRDGSWVNVLEASHRGRTWAPRSVDRHQHRPSGHRSSVPSDHKPSRSEPCDTSESGREWGWVCGLIEAGGDAHQIYERLVDRARPRRGKDAERYARRTVKRAVNRIDRLAHAKEVPLTS